MKRSITGKQRLIIVLCACWIVSIAFWMNFWEWTYRDGDFVPFAVVGIGPLAVISAGVWVFNGFHITKGRRMRLEKIAIVKKYLSQVFRDCAVENTREIDRMAEVFKINFGQNIYLLKISDEFLDDNSCVKITATFAELHVAKCLSVNKNKTVLLTNFGLEVV